MRHLPAVIVLIVGAVFGVLSYLGFVEFGKSEKASDFESKAAERLAAVEQRLISELAVVDTLVAYFSVDNEPNRAEFKRVVGLASADRAQPAHQALEWIPKVAHADRLRLRRHARADGFASFEFKERSADGKMVAATKRETYFPVYYLEPLEGNEGALGFDLASNPTRLEALETARDTGRKVVSGRINLVQAADDPAGVLVFAPVYPGAIAPATVAERRRLLSGFALGVFRVSKLVSGAFLSAATNSKLKQPGGVDLYLFDTSGNSAGELVYIHHSRQRAGKAPVLELASARRGLQFEQLINVGGRSWVFVARPVDTAIDSIWHLTGGGAMLGVFLISLLLAVYLNKSVNVAREIGLLVDRRTAELREATEHSIMNETRVSAVLNTVVDGIITIDEVGIVESVNPAALKTFGYTEDQIVGRNVNMLMPDPYHREHDAYLKRYREVRRGAHHRHRTRGRGPAP